MSTINFFGPSEAASGRQARSSSLDHGPTTLPSSFNVVACGPGCTVILSVSLARPVPRLYHGTWKAKGTQREGPLAFSLITSGLGSMAAESVPKHSQP